MNPMTTPMENTVPIGATWSQNPCSLGDQAVLGEHADVGRQGRRDPPAEAVEVHARPHAQQPHRHLVVARGRPAAVGEDVWPGWSRS